MKIKKNEGPITAQVGNSFYTFKNGEVLEIPEKDANILLKNGIPGYSRYNSDDTKHLDAKKKKKGD